MMEKILREILNQYQDFGYIDFMLADEAKKYDRTNPAWVDLANDEMREAWTIVQNDDLHV